MDSAIFRAAVRTIRNEYEVTARDEHGARSLEARRAAAELSSLIAWLKGHAG